MNNNILPFNGFKPDIDSSVFLAPGSCIIGNVTIGKNSSIWFGSVLRGDINKIIIGENTNIQDGSTIHVDKDLPCTVGNNVTVGHNVILHACEIGNNVLIGMGAIILDGVKIGDGAQIGAGAVVSPRKNITANSLYLGIPAKKARNLRPDESHAILQNASSYSNLSKQYLKEFPGLNSCKN
jgi:carbonic anhydrase/acetyltransferase-like protein (isoleucine patch superfamily)